MAVSEQTPYVEYTANGIATSFALEFDCENQDHLIVLVDDVEPVVGTWSLSNGAVVFNTAPENGKNITIQRNTPFSRNTDYQSYNNSFRPQSVNGDFDRVWLKLQELGVTDWLLRLYIDRLHGEQKTYIDQKDTQLQNNINSLSTHVDQQDAQLQQNIDNLKTYVDDRDDELRAYLMEEIRKQGVALDQLDDYYNYLMQRLAQIAVDKGWDASFVTYQGITQEKVNDGLSTISEMLSISTPKNGMRIFVKGLQGGWFEYNSSKSGQNDGGTVFNGWVRIHYLNKMANLSWFGAVPSDINKAAANESKIIIAIKHGNIIVDGNYFTTCLLSNEIANSFSLLGESNNSSIEVVGEVNANGWLKLGDIASIKLLGVNFSAQTHTNPLFRPNTDVVEIQSFMIDGGSFTKIHLFYAWYSSTINPETKFYGIRNLKIKNVFTSELKSFFTAVNMQHDLIEIDHVVSRNISACPFYFATDNAHSYPLQLVLKQKRLEFTYSNAVNSDDYFSTEGAYFCYCLYEGNSALYARNWVEGLKTRENIATYDLYFSGGTLDYIGNTWKNNLCMNSAKVNNELMKSKGGIVSRYSGSTFILEKDFVVRHGADVAGQDWVTLLEKTNGNDRSRMIVEGCRFEIHKLLGMSSSGHTKNIEIKHNAFKIGTIAASFLNIRNFGTDITTYTDADVVVYDNDFIIDEVGWITRNGSLYNDFTFIKMNYNKESTAGIYRKIRANKNKFSINKLNGNFYLGEGLAANNIDFDDTEIISYDSAATTQLRPYFGFTDISCGISAKNQVIKTLGGGQLDINALSTKLSGDKSCNIEYLVKTKGKNFTLDVFPPSSASLLVKVAIEIIGNGVGIGSAFYNVKLTQAGIEYTDTSGVAQIATYPPSGGNALIINPMVYASPGSSVLSNIRFSLRPKDTSFGALGLNISPTGISGGSEYQYKINVDTFPI